MEIGKIYKITFETGGKTLTFTGEVLALTDKIVTFSDKFKKILNYNLKNLVSYEEVKDGN